MTKEEAEYIFYNTPEKIKDMILDLPDDESIAFSRLISEVAKESELYKASAKYREEIAEGDRQIDQFEDSCAQEAAANLIAEEKIDYHFKNLEESYESIKTTLIDGINKGEDQLRPIARDMIEIEQEHNLFDPETWKDFDELPNLL
jgi:hypothetical protein